MLEVDANGEAGSVEMKGNKAEGSLGFGARSIPAGPARLAKATRYAPLTAVSEHQVRGHQPPATATPDLPEAHLDILSSFRRRRRHRDGCGCLTSLEAPEFSCLCPCAVASSTEHLTCTAGLTGTGTA